MRITLFTDADVFAGTERHMLDLARGLRGERADVTLACPAGSPLATAAAAEGFAHLPIEKIGRIDHRAARTLARKLRTGEIDVLHAHNGRTALAAALAKSLARRGSLVLTQHFLMPGHTARSGPKRSASRLAHRWINRQADHLIAISQAVRERMLDRADAPDEKITVIPNGITPPDIESLKTPEQVREELGVAPGTPLVVCAARLQQEKDVGSLITAMATVTRSLPHARCLVAGEGELHAALTNQIERLSLDRSVRLLGFRKDVLSLIHAADLFVLPSLAEPFGLVLLEAMALSKPVLATAAGGPTEIVEHQTTGLLVPPSDPSAMADAIVRLLHDPAQRARMGRAGRERFEQHFTAARMAQSMLGVYQSTRNQPSLSTPRPTHLPTTD